MKLSIVTPSFNQGFFIRKTIESVLQQDYKNLEYIIMDGGSQDNTVQILREYDNEIYWESKEDKGQADAVNQGILRVTGEIIGWLNSDDIYYPGTFSIVMEAFEKNPEVKVIYGNAYHIDVDDNIIEEYYTEDFNFERLKDICYICQPSLFFRRSIIDQYGYLDERLHYCMDYEYWLRLAEYEKFMRLNQFIAGSRLYPDNKTLGAQVKVHEEIVEMLKRNFGKVSSRWIYGLARAKVNTSGINRTLNGKGTNNLHFMQMLFQTLHLSIKYNKSLPYKDAKQVITWRFQTRKYRN